MQISVHKNRIYQYMAALTGTLGIVSSEMHYGWPSPTLPILLNGTDKLQMDETEGSWLTIMPLVGAILGAIITGLVIDILGRKRLILLSSIPFFISWITIGFAETSVLLHVARFLAGLTDGLSFTAVPMFLGEIAEPSIRGLLSSMCPVSIVIGLLLINILGSYLTISTTAFVSSIIPVILLVTFVWIPESPYFLLMRGRYDDARSSLQKFRGSTDVETELERLAKAVKEQNESTGKFVDLVTCPSNRKAVFIALGLRSVQQLTGITAVTFYCKRVFEKSSNFIAPEVATIIYFTVQLVLSAISCLMVDISGRRPLLIISLAGTAVTLLINGTYLYIKNCTEVDTKDFDFVLLATLLCFIVIFSLGLQTIPLLIMSEMFPTNVKAFALCLADVYFSVIASVISKFFHGTSNAFGMHVPFYTFTVCCVFGLVFIVLWVPETKGRTLEDIQRFLKGEIKM
ncbi:facilitated trehalose transporter Tret1 [Tribolium castaneum]|uniref:Facilitated trehalose transporter Tret1-2 homolog-like Protein n=1 Tax=Tribolium castaneum TaxID=7070 RepID=D6WET5_TRICA|nr:PREDICTED: facilitated trehalose transporter Tret1 [Tribolium castaneum]EFA00433.1 Facilitated trehalose transporter Tret1-2 homolog-like Protein [Tribolium castaneum]|eukprot:XP_974346.1 PREDICTED: facilitated trehalose transporter Tret1 [Tribolium castaneum]